MGPTIDDLCPATPATMSPRLRITAGRVILTTVDGPRGICRQVLTERQAADLIGDVARLVLIGLNGGTKTEKSVVTQGREID